MSSRNVLVVGLAFLGGFFLFLILLLVIGLFWALKGKPSLPHGDQIGVIEIKGLISEADGHLEDLRKFSRNDAIKAIVVRIESPGGAVGASQEIYRELKRISEKKPVVASMGSVAASGGLYVALGARKIVADPGTLTGSIGVMIQIPNIRKLLERIGIEATVLKSGPYKDTGSLLRPLTKEEKELLMDTIRDVYTQFVQAVSESRGIPVEEVKKFADGRVFTGRRAKELGLVDVLGNFEDAVDLAAEMAGIKGPPHLVYPEEEKPWIKWLMTKSLAPKGLVLLFAPLYLAEI
ncbi:MAG: signal peptide peptidase SppA [Thermodesulfobacteria bacterium]|nr:signal peptide peptidase SppA [Thermodesulfobacteriota bacterium]